MAVAAPAGATSSAAARAAQIARWAGALACGALLMGLLVQPVGPQAQLALSLSAIVAMLVIRQVAPTSQLARCAVGALGCVVVLRYMYWRATGTLPPIEDWFEFSLGAILLLAELYCVMILGVGLIINAEPLKRALIAVEADEALPTVDVFIPSYNEDASLLAMTVAAARNLDYPAGKLTVWLLDDGGTDQKCGQDDAGKAAAARRRRAELQTLCEDLGARYLTRARNEHAKAGNLNNGLANSQGEIVVVLDADHVPFRSFLRDTVGHFAADPRLFLVQTPHVFINPDPLEKNLRTFETMPSENEMFYGVTQRGLDKWNGSFFCGSAALLRRAALDETGGFSGITITEDCETALELHARGWTSVYVEKPLVAGLQPDTFADFIGQRSRWCQGMFQILLLKNPALRRGLKPVQRLAYLSSMGFWFFPLPRLMFMFAPLLHIFLDVRVFVATIEEAVAYTATYVVTNAILQSHLYGEVRRPWVSELYEYVQGVYLLKAIVSVIASPRKPTFSVTAKGVATDRETLSPLATPFIAIFVVLAAGVLTAAYRYAFEPAATNLMLVVGLWCLFNLVIAGAALGVVAERRTDEAAPSLAVERRGWLQLGETSVAVAISRVSAIACTVKPDQAIAPSALDLPAMLHVDVAEDRAAPRALAVGVTPAGDDASGDKVWRLEFLNLEAADHAALAELMYGDSQAIGRFIAKRRGRMSIAEGSLRFLAWSVLEPVRAIRYGIADFRFARRAQKKADAPVAVATKPAATITPIAQPQIALDQVALGQVAPSQAAPSLPAQLQVAQPKVAQTKVTPASPVATPRMPEAADAAHGRPAVPLTADAWREAILALARDELDDGQDDLVTAPGSAQRAA